MDARTASFIQGAGRMAFGLGFIFAPGATGAGWIGADADRRGTQVMTGAMGARDLALGAGQILATRDGHGVDRWLQAGMLADAVDLVATLRARDRVPASGVASVAFFATASILTAAWLSRAEL